MTISNYQISSVIKTYMRNMKVKAKCVEEEPTNGSPIHEDNVMISEEGMKKMLYDRIGEQMTERLKRYE
ncbi:MAG: hypothetical protein NT178_13080 [Proteobacteria bacterium]|nr:hypothetical protein [Pseudomonadota bacterium]